VQRLGQEVVYFSHALSARWEVWMRTFRHLVAAAVIVGIGGTSAVAEQRHVVDAAAIAGAVQNHLTAEERNRSAVLEALARPEVARVAGATGTDLGRLRASVGTMSPADLERAAASAREVNQSLIGGASTVTISTTTIIIGLLVLILLIVALD
jgi:hypothetical protein